MRVFKNILYTGIVCIGLFGMVSCAKKAQNAENGPQLEMQSEEMKLPDAPKDAAPKPKIAAVKQPALGQDIVESSMVGVWVLKGESCDSSNGIVFDTDGKYAADGEEGMWQADGDEIEIKLAALSDSGNDELKIKVLTLGSADAILQRPDGSNVEWHRCPNVPNLAAKKAEETAK